MTPPPPRDLTAERAAAEDVYYGLQVMNTPDYNLREADMERDIQAIITLIQQTRQEALREAARRLGLGDCSGLLDAPCLWCGYSGRGYYQAGTHDKSCIWHTVGGRNERLDRLASEGGMRWYGLMVE